MTLEEILQELGCKHPIRKKPVGDKHSPNYLTNNGWVAYDKLLRILYSLDSLCPGYINVSDLVDELDNIISEKDY